MNKAAIKRFAVWARTKLMADIRTRLGFVGITEDEVKAPLPSSTKEIQYFQGAGTEPVSVKGKNILARKDLAEKLQKDARRSDYKIAYESLVETTASAWFNRLIAIRFMEVNDYLSDGIRMLSSAEAGKTDPDIVTAPFDSDLEFTEAEKEKIVQFKLNSETDRAFRILFFKRCHQLQKFLPGLFEKEGDATEFLMRLSVVDTDGVIYRLVHEIPEEDFRVSEGGQVEIIGWMYQYYNSELKDDTFAKLKKNIKVTKERIPSATQLFTPDWIVRYMVENSLGRIVVNSDKGVVDSESEEERIAREEEIAQKFGWKYYIPEAKQEPEVRNKLRELRKNLPTIHYLLPTIKIIDPCMGSGHILSYLFDVLMQIYEEEGYDARDAVEQIATKNLYGLDIDDRAGQLAYFTVMMKARQYDRGFFSRGIQPNVQAIQESNGCKTWAEVAGDSLVNGQLTLDDRFVQMVDELIETFHDAKEYGSLLTVKADDYGGLLDYIGQMAEQGSNNLLFSAWLEEIKEKIAPLAKQAMWFSQKYDVVVTNPPYMGSSNMGAKLSAFVKKYYPDSKSDLFACFMEKCGELTKEHGYQAMITQHSWMFLSSFEKLRKKLLKKTIVNMAHLGPRAFEEIGGEVVQTTSFVMKNEWTKGCNGTYARLIEPITQQGKEKMFLSNENRFVTKQENFAKIPGASVAYWVSNHFICLFDEKRLGGIVQQKMRINTGDNVRFLRMWYEVDVNKMFRPKRWVPFSKGGAYRKWYGNWDYLVDYLDNGAGFKACPGYRGSDEKNFFKEGIVWTDLSSGGVSFRFFPVDCIASAAGPMIGIEDPNYNVLYILSVLNSIVAKYFTIFLCATIHFQWGDIAKIPIILKESDIVINYCKHNVSISKADWDSFETSWDFKRHPLV